MGILISIGKYGGFYAHKSLFGLRICLGWMALTIFMRDGDKLLHMAAIGANALAVMSPEDAKKVLAVTRTVTNGG